MASHPSTAQIIGDRIRARRQELGLSQEKLGLASGVHWTVVSQAERGKRSVSIQTLLKLAVGLQMDAGELLRGLTPESE
jgi:transcriptional regulator with XRE-family HTH domain